MSDFDDGYHRAIETAKEVDTSKKGWWRPFLMWVLYPLIVLGLIAVLVIQFVTLSKAEVVAVPVENPEDEVVEVPALMLQ